MIDWKKAAIVAASAFIISFLVGLLGGVAFAHILIRAFIFSALFFGLFFGVWYICSRFLPELLSSGSKGDQADEEDAEPAGSRLDIAVDDSFAPSQAGAAPPAGAAAALDPAQTQDEGDEELEELDGEADELESIGEEETGLDRRGEAGYTGESSPESVPPGAAGTPEPLGPVQYAKPLGGFDDVDKLPDLDGFSDSFVSGPASSDEDVAGPAKADDVPAGAFSASTSGSSGGNFDTKEMVSAIQTMLKRDQKG